MGSGDIRRVSSVDTRKLDVSYIDREDGGEEMESIKCRNEDIEHIDRGEWREEMEMKSIKCR